MWGDKMIGDRIRRRNMMNTFSIHKVQMHETIEKEYKSVRTIVVTQNSVVLEHANSDSTILPKYDVKIPTQGWFCGVEFYVTQGEERGDDPNLYLTFGSLVRVWFDGNQYNVYAR